MSTLDLLIKDYAFDVGNIIKCQLDYATAKSQLIYDNLPKFIMTPLYNSNSYMLKHKVFKYVESGGSLVYQYEDVAKVSNERTAQRYIDRINRSIIELD